jgi:pimeloyl-ACP methyl ester carboxylesterase
MATIELDGAAIYYERNGRGPAILFIHGAFGDADNWADQAPRFSDRYTCVRYDRRGFSRSSRGDASLGVALHADDAAALIDGLQLAPCLVVGSSAGAIITLDLAMRHGRLVRGVVLCEPPLFTLDPAAFDAASAERRRRVEAAMASGGPRAAVDAFASLTFPEGWAMLDENRRNRFRDNAEPGFADVANAPLAIDPAELSSVTSPALVIAGTKSHPAIRAINHELVRRLLDARLVELDSGHLPYIECPDRFADAVSIFGAEIDRRTSVTSS